MSYAFMTQNLDAKGRRDLDLALAPPEEREAIIDRTNAAEMAKMGIGMVGPKPVPLKPRGG